MRKHTMQRIAAVRKILGAHAHNCGRSLSELQNFNFGRSFRSSKCADSSSFPRSADSADTVSCL